MLLVNLFKAIFALYSIAVYNLSNTNTTGLTNSTSGVPLIAPVFSVTILQLNTDVCPFAWPIQRRDLYPITTLNTVAATLMFLEPVSVKPNPQNTCPILLPIQRYNTRPTTTINDVAVAVASHYTALDKPSDAIAPTRLSEISFITLVPLFYITLATLCLVYCYRKWLESTNLAQVQLAGQAELIQSLRMQVEASNAREHRSTLRIRQLEAINMSQRVKINRQQHLNIDTTGRQCGSDAFQSTSLFSTTPDASLLTLSPTTPTSSSPSLAPHTTDTLTCPPDHLPTATLYISEGSGSPHEVVEIKMEPPSSPSLLNTVSDNSNGNNEPLLPPVSNNDDNPWEVVQRSKKRRGRRDIQ